MKVSMARKILRGSFACVLLAGAAPPAGADDSWIAAEMSPAELRRQTQPFSYERIIPRRLQIKCLTGDCSLFPWHQEARHAVVPLSDRLNQLGIGFGITTSLE